MTATTTLEQDGEFAELVMNLDLHEMFLEQVKDSGIFRGVLRDALYGIDWTNFLEHVRTHFAPENVYTDQQLMTWLREHVSEVGENYAPEEVFSVERLAHWAEQNGYVMKGST